MSGEDLLTLAAAVTTGLVGGLFYGWSVSVIPGTRRVPDQTYVATMQSVNRAIINPFFLLPFLGALVLLVAAALVASASGATARGYWLSAAAATYGVGVLGVTIGRNVPLNDRLGALDRAGASDAEVARARAAYEGPWNRWHQVRMAASVAAFALATAAVLADPGA